MYIQMGLYHILIMLVKKEILQVHIRQQHVQRLLQQRTCPRIKNTITASDNVDIYDGGHVNGYTLTSGSTDDKFLNTITTYKSPDNSTTYGTSNSLFTLAGNSITKVRVYIWLEGQDIDNYDVISKNSNVRISFGLTKDVYGVGS